MDTKPLIEQLLTASDVAASLSISVRSVWRWVALGKIPPPLKLTKRSSRWKASEIQGLIDTLRSSKAG